MKNALHFPLVIALLLAACDSTPGSGGDGGSGPDTPSPHPDGGGTSAGGGGSGTSAGGGGNGDTSPPPGTLSDRYADDVGIAGDPAVLFHDDFEQGWGRWDGPTADTRYLHIETDPAAAHAGQGYLRSTVTTADLAEETYISSSTWVTHARVDATYWRFHVRFPELAPNPHHWVRMAAGTES